MKFLKETGLLIVLFSIVGVGCWAMESPEDLDRQLEGLFKKKVTRIDIGSDTVEVLKGPSAKQIKTLREKEESLSQEVSSEVPDDVIKKEFAVFFRYPKLSKNLFKKKAKEFGKELESREEAGDWTEGFVLYQKPGQKIEKYGLTGLEKRKEVLDRLAQSLDKKNAFLLEDELELIEYDLKELRSAVLGEMVFRRIKLLKSKVENDTETTQEISDKRNLVLAKINNLINSYFDSRRKIIRWRIRKKRPILFESETALEMKNAQEAFFYYDKNLGSYFRQRRVVFLLDEIVRINARELEAPIFSKSTEKEKEVLRELEEKYNYAKSILQERIEKFSYMIEKFEHENRSKAFRWMRRKLNRS